MIQGDVLLCGWACACEKGGCWGVYLHLKFRAKACEQAFSPLQALSTHLGAATTTPTRKHLGNTFWVLLAWALKAPPYLCGCHWFTPSMLPITSNIDLLLLTLMDSAKFLMYTSKLQLGLALPCCYLSPGMTQERNKKPDQRHLAKGTKGGPPAVAQLAGCHPTQAKSCRFDSWSGHRPGLWAWSLVRMPARGNRSMFLSHIDISLTLSPSIPLSLRINK